MLSPQALGAISESLCLDALSAHPLMSRPAFVCCGYTTVLVHLNADHAHQPQSHSSPPSKSLVLGFLAFGPFLSLIHWYQRR